MLKHYVEYLYPCIRVSPYHYIDKRSVREIPERDISKVELSDYCLGFRFFDKIVTGMEGENYATDKKNVSGWYYRGEKMTLEQVKENFGNDGEHNYLIAHMEREGCAAVVKNKFGQFIPLHDDDTVI